LKSPADAKALAEILPPMMPELFKAEDAIRCRSLSSLDRMARAARGRTTRCRARRRSH
jgi:hypothetical protein